jgi:hypothetical protein
MERVTIIEFRIGRNIGTVPMEQDRWDRCVREAVSILEGVAAGVAVRRVVEPLVCWTEVHRGAGTWRADDGSVVREESAVVSLYVEADLLELAGVREVLVDFAAELAGEFGQEAVALVWQGEAELVRAEVAA